MRIDSKPFPEGTIDPLYEIIWRLPPLLQPPPIVESENSDYLALIPLYLEDGDPPEILDIYIKAALYSRWSALQYTDAVPQGVPIKFYADVNLYDSLYPLLFTNFIDMDKDVIWFYPPPLPFSKDGWYPPKARDTLIFSDKQLRKYARVIVWDALCFFMPSPSALFHKLKGMREESIGYLYTTLSKWERIRPHVCQEVDYILRSLEMEPLPFVEESGVGALAPETSLSVVDILWTYPPNFAFENKIEFVDWMRQFAPYFGANWVSASFYQHLFSWDIVSLNMTFGLGSNSTALFFQNEPRPDGCILHGGISLSDENEKKFRETLGIQ